MDLEGPLNGIELSRVIPLDGTLFINGTTTFRNLEVTESLKVTSSSFD